MTKTTTRQHWRLVDGDPGCKERTHVVPISEAANHVLLLNSHDIIVVDGDNIDAIRLDSAEQLRELESHATQIHDMLIANTAAPV